MAKYAIASRQVVGLRREALHRISEAIWNASGNPGERDFYEKQRVKVDSFLRLEF
jgi:hypothetical protein